MGMAILAFAFAKILLYDLSSVNTNLKVLLFIITGVVLLGLSYFFHQKKIVE